MDNKPHWYPLNEHDETTGVELPRPTVLPPRADSDNNGPLLSSPRPRPRRDKSTSTSVRDVSSMLI